MNLKETLNLPDAAFTIPMKADLPQREPEIQKIWAEMDVYRTLQRERAGRPTFILHDGPPYTNSPIHTGTAMNKILKDFVVKSRTLMGFRAPYVPGYDNHGLPIEMAVQKKLRDQKIDYDIPTLRKACREHAQHYIGIQSVQFQRLGVFGLWEKAYNSLDFAYEAEIVRIFRRLVEAGYIYRGLRPVLWSPTSRTALADTEIIYQDHVSRAIYVAFPLKADAKGLFQHHPKAEAVIWTTTPWTIPANVALAFHPGLTYDLVRAGGRELLILRELKEKTLAAAGLPDQGTLASFTGAELEGTIFAHPIYGRDSIAVTADYVTTEDGTGIVHTAPGHGREDFMTGQKFGLPILCPVDEKGVLTAEAPGFEGVGFKECDTVVVEKLEDKGALLAASDHHHPYPHAERDGKPVIFRATEQWFIGIDLHDLRQKMLGEIEKVGWHPGSGQTRITAMIGGRPDWCISRQRPWGVGIPVFYGEESGEPVLDSVAINAVADLVQREGSDAWYVRTPEEILPEGYRHPVTGETKFRKET
ncbi:MAG: class I tRNA ligase family protein, partial [Fimbriimonadaceae bacterium]|nr:class I tRNA ligase family protein [Fimbriimonadaceae bacterium]